MNSVSLIGRLTRDPDVRYAAETQRAVARFSIAIDRGKDRNGNDLGTDFPTIVCFGKTAELVERYIKKGRLVGIQGRLQTVFYDKAGPKIYTTDVLADRVEFLDRADRSESDGGGFASRAGQTGFGAQQDPGYGSDRGGASGGEIPGGFTKLTDDDIPF